LDYLTNTIALPVIKCFYIISVAYSYLLLIFKQSSSKKSILNNNSETRTLN